MVMVPEINSGETQVPKTLSAPASCLCSNIVFVWVSSDRPCTLLQAIYSEDISKRMGNEPIVQALKELMKYEMAMLITEDEDDKSLRTGTGSRGNHDNVDAIC